MVFTGKRKKLLACLGVVCSVMLIVLSGWKIVSQLIWYDDFYAALKTQDIKDYRLLFVWVQGDVQRKYRPIGGNDRAFNAWKNAVENFLSQATAREKRHSTRSFVYVEVVVDEPTRILHATVFDAWHKKYKAHIVITPLETITKKYPQLAQGLEQCSKGVPALCSDMLRIWYLPTNSTMNVYMDVDLFTQMHYEPWRTSSAISFGMRAVPHTLSHTYLVDKGTARINNDMLIDYRYTDWKKLQSLAHTQWKRFDYPLHVLTTRTLWLQSSTYYYTQLDERVLWYKMHPDVNVHPVNMMVHVCGPAFFERLYAAGLTQAYPMPLTPNAGSWIEGPSHVKSVSGYMTYGDLLRNMGSIWAEQILRLMLMASDYQYLVSQDAVWRCKLVGDITDSWSTLSETQKQGLKKVLHTPILWAEIIAGTSCTKGV